MSDTFSALFLALLVATTLIRVWLASRQIRHVRAHRGAVPEAFAHSIPQTSHQTAADYTVARVRLGMLDLLTSAGVLWGFTLGGGLSVLYALTGGWVPAGYAHGIAFIGLVSLINGLIDLPFDLYRTFGVEARFGFNKTTVKVYLADLLKSLLLAVVIGVPVLLVVLWLMEGMGSLWWLYVWLFITAFNLLVLLAYPTFIAPLFNKFSPLEDAALKARIEGLLGRCGFASSGVFVMDGSRRSSHGNAYFTGFGRAKRIVFFDTLLSRLSAEEIEAVLAHELGHYRHHHIWKRIAISLAGSLALLFVLGQVIEQPWFYAGLGFEGGGTAAALMLFMMVAPVFLFPLKPLMSLLSRKHEFEADAFAAKQCGPRHLVSALVKLYRDNAATLTPDPLYSALHDSHPPAMIRIRQLEAGAAA